MCAVLNGQGWLIFIDSLLPLDLYQRGPSSVRIKPDQGYASTLSFL